jgi:transmembrane sensor
MSATRERRDAHATHESRRLDEKLAPAIEEAEIADVWRSVREARAEAPARRRRRVMVGVGVGVGVGVAAIAAAAVIAMVAGGGGGGGRGARGDGSGVMGSGSGVMGNGAERATDSGQRPTGNGQSPDGATTMGSSVAVRGPLASAGLVLEPGVRLKPDAERSIEMNDGSVVALAAASELEVLANEGDKFVAAVRKGSAHFDVKPGGPRTWVVETDLATVEVVGTAFVVARSEESLIVKVERGVVLVSGERVPGRVVRLVAGEQLEVPGQIASASSAVRAEQGASAVRGAQGAGPVRPERSAERGVEGRTPPAPSASTSPPSARTSPPSASTAPPSAAETAIAKADELLAKGKAIEAADELDRFLDDAGNDAAAGLAAFMLGRIAQDQLGDPERAAAAFAKTLAIGSPRAVQDEARTRRARALAAAGRTEP